jgi:TatD DNase family protein
VWTDSHCHLGSTDEVDEAAAAGVRRLVCVGADQASSEAAVAFAATRDSVWATVGLHPHDAIDGAGFVADLVTRPRVVAVGECGLDYHYDRSPRPVQRDVFAAQIEFAAAERLPLVIHTREAWDDTFAVLASAPAPPRVVFHCFTGGPDEARRALDTGAWLSFSGIVTFKNADDVRGAAALCPLDRLLVETDAPYLAPVPHRGQRNRPALVPVVGAAVAAVKQLAPEEVEAASWTNAEAVFGLG